ncbi:hypothetical protein MPTK1_7g17730 [Marchantia polymorpha subsp. ruderalis]|uniref:Uncharacterized protein n=2 Tax=Marchantia polymorpha TaxID=3197 RepID=A0AAF6C0V3_MARPO|nr:hypothetical protein MARPO_0051s0109 [Marchantia polymorpha]BBN17887.1 hypothetical protein Mp_7g17730 [Marchantia polymorpha subsp. ruderalis]|eukprot:PTQ38511.1 hypothetical protein MARPO_0051s0109 [Marchantia polymorpha]
MTSTREGSRLGCLPPTPSYESSTGGGSFPRDSELYRKLNVHSWPRSKHCWCREW